MFQFDDTVAAMGTEVFRQRMCPEFIVFLMTEILSES